MNILIIGNGFDLAHGLPTKYTDFLDMVTKANDDKNIVWANNRPLNVENNNADAALLRFAELVGYDKYEEFRRFVNDSFWINYFTKRREKLGKEWFDFEEEISKEIKRAKSAMQMCKNEIVDASSGLDALLDAFCKKRSFYSDKPTWDDLFITLFKELKKLISALEIYMDGYVNKLPISKINFFPAERINKLLSFNYTSVFTENYSVPDDICYLHGRADMKSNECNMVLGYNDYYLYEKQNVREVIPFEKYYQRIVNENDNQYMDWIEYCNRDSVVNAYIFGHSLSPSDGDVLRSFLSEVTSCHIYYVSELDRAEKVKNLAIILGPDKLIELTGGPKKRIYFEYIHTK